MLSLWRRSLLVMLNEHGQLLFLENPSEEETYGSHFPNKKEKRVTFFIPSAKITVARSGDVVHSYSSFLWAKTGNQTITSKSQQMKKTKIISTRYIMIQVLSLPGQTLKT